MQNCRLAQSLVLAVAAVLITAFSAELSAAEVAGRFTVHMVGDSTMADKPLLPANPERGWGQLLPLYFKDNVKVANYAMNGRSSKSFIDEGRWEKVVAALQGLPAKVVRMQVMDAESLTAVSGDVNRELDTLNNEVSAFEETLRLPALDPVRTSS